jgi:hypothetical protein
MTYVCSRELLTATDTSTFSYLSILSLILSKKNVQKVVPRRLYDLDSKGYSGVCICALTLPLLFKIYYA